MDQSFHDDTPSGSTRRKRRTRKRRKEIDRSLLTWLRSPKGERGVLLTMLVASLGLGVVRGEELRQAMHDFGGISIGMSASEVRYALGNPTQEMPQTRQWQYSNARHTELVSFNAAGKVERYSCSEDGLVQARCASILGLHIGTTERDLLLRLGKPNETVLAGAEKRLVYKGAGLAFRLRQGAVAEITVIPATGLVSKLKQLAWLMLP